jgi:aspartyl-tRNA(Asn)/glutamyl-tRNA(Gln) amidotransferase subunit B
MTYEAVIGLEVHAELQTRSKMFCACPVLDSTQAQPNRAVCPVCAGMPGVLPVVNQQAVELALRVALALGCQVAHTSLFARKNYFYPDLPKGYQISQYEYPLAVNGFLPIHTAVGERRIRIRRVHLEEDTGKLTHITNSTESFSLVDLNRAGVPLLEIVSEPDLHSAEEVRAYATELRALLRALGVNSGDMQKGVIRFEANISVRPSGSQELGTRTEVKNLNSFRALERATLYEIHRQSALLDAGQLVRQETLGWDDINEVTLSQRSKEEAHDYRYFPEPDLPPLVVEQDWIDRVAASLPELPYARIQRFQQQYGLGADEASLLGSEAAVAQGFEDCLRANNSLTPRLVANWFLGEVFAWLNVTGRSFEQLPVSMEALAELFALTQRGEINLSSAKTVLVEMLESGQRAGEIIAGRGLRQISDHTTIAELVQRVLAENPGELQAYRKGKVTLANWFFGQVMRLAEGQANPQIVRAELEKQLNQLE